MAGQILASGLISAKMLSGHLNEAAHSRIERLSDREFKVFQLVGLG
jgi:hypothetical protein